jgi:uncharacterized Zn-binding protein involved in type VI secretion
MIQRIGDVNVAGGVILTGEPTVLVNFRPVATVGSAVSPHPPCPKGGIHCGALTTTKSPRILVNFKPITTSGTIDTCGHPRVTGSLTVIAGLL